MMGIFFFCLMKHVVYEPSRVRGDIRTVHTVACYPQCCESAPGMKDDNRQLHLVVSIANVLRVTICMEKATTYSHAEHPLVDAICRIVHTGPALPIVESESVRTQELGQWYFSCQPRNCTRRTRLATPQDYRREFHRSRLSPAMPWPPLFEKQQQQWHDCTRAVIGSSRGLGFRRHITSQCSTTIVLALWKHSV